MMTQILARLALCGALIAGPGLGPVLAQDTPAPSPVEPQADAAEQETAQRRAAAEAAARAESAYLIGRHAYIRGDLETAWQRLSEALKADGGNLELRARVFYLGLATGRIQEAADTGGPLAEDERLAFLVRVAQMVAAVARDDLATARGIDLAVEGLDESESFRDLIAGWLALGTPTQQEAIDSVRRRLTLRRNTAPVDQLHLALLQAAGGQLEPAHATLVASLSDGAALRQARFLAALELALGRRERAAAAYGRMQLTRDTPILIEQDLTLLDQGRLPLALPLTARDGIAEVLYDQASLFDALQGDDRALAFARMAEHLKPNSDMIHLLLADILAEREDLTGAEAAYRRIPAESALGWLARLRVADLLESREAVDEALALLTAMEAERPERPDVPGRIGDLHRRRQEFKAAIEPYTRAIERIGTPTEDHWRYFYSRGIVHERSDLWPQAEADFLKALELNPDQPDVLNYLGYSWADQGVRLEEALGMIERAVKQRPEDGYIIDSLGWALYRLGRFDEALPHLERAAQLEPGDADIVDHYGDVLYVLGRQREAVYVWGRALRAAREDAERYAELIPKIEKKLKDGL